MIINANKSHIPYLLVLCGDMHKESIYCDIPLDNRKLELFLERHIDSESSLFLVVEKEGELVGMFVAALDYYFFSNEMLSQDLIFYLSRQYRGSRAASQIVSRYVDWCRGKGVKEACLSTTTGITSERTCSFYESMGFRQVGFVNKLKLL